MAGASRTPAAGRRYGGRTAEERHAERREQLVGAGVQLIGTGGFGNTSIRAVLRESGLAERYFYESFDSLQSLLVAVHEHVHERVVARVRDATADPTLDTEARARAGLLAFVQTITSDPRWVKIKLAELGSSESEAMATFRRRAHDEYAELLVRYGPTAATSARGLQPHALALAVIAGVESLLDSWASGQLRMTLDELIDHSVVIIKGTSSELEREIA
ncbi:MAG: TetR family transcriptional regulator [Solirubrobacteraceae bacterium]|nr:TetR family transcriptional regulator [Patulibacter sp.]